MCLEGDIALMNSMFLVFKKTPKSLHLSDFRHWPYSFPFTYLSPEYLLHIFSNMNPPAD